MIATMSMMHDRSGSGSYGGGGGGGGALDSPTGGGGHGGRQMSSPGGMMSKITLVRAPSLSKGKGDEGGMQSRQ